MTFDEYISQCHDNDHQERKQIYEDDTVDICEPCYRQYVRKEIMPQVLEAAGVKK